MDDITCKYVRRWLRLPLCTSRHFMFSARRHGGLGLPRMTAVGPIARIRTLMDCYLSQDPALVKIADEQQYFQQAKSMADSFSLPLPVVGKRYTKVNWLVEEYSRWCKQPVQGSGAKSFGTPASNSWNRTWDRGTFRPGQIIAAHLLGWKKQGNNWSYFSPLLGKWHARNSPNIRYPSQRLAWQKYVRRNNENGNQ